MGRFLNAKYIASSVFLLFKLLLQWF